MCAGSAPPCARRRRPAPHGASTALLAPSPVRPYSLRGFAPQARARALPPTALRRRLLSPRGCRCCAGALGRDPPIGQPLVRCTLATRRPAHTTAPPRHAHRATAVAGASAGVAGSLCRATHDQPTGPRPGVGGAPAPSRIAPGGGLAASDSPGRPRAPRPLPRRRRRGAALLLLTPLLLLLLDFSLLALSLDALLAALHVAEPAPDASPLRFGSDGRPAGRSGAGQRAVCCVVFSVTRVSSFVFSRTCVVLRVLA